MDLQVGVESRGLDFGWLRRLILKILHDNRYTSFWPSKTLVQKADTGPSVSVVVGSGAWRNFV